MLKIKKIITCLLTASFLIPNVSKGEAKADTNVTTPPLQQTFDSSNINVLYVGKDGNLYSTGYGGNGALGNGSTENHYSEFVKVDLPSGEIAKQVDVNYNNSAIALTKSGNVYIWGEGANLSDGSNLLSPVKINIPTTSEIVEVKSLGKSFYALDSKGSLWLFGSKSSWSGSDGNMSEALELKSPDDSGIKDFCVCDCSLLIYSNDGILYSCGFNLRGQLGLGNTTNVYNRFERVPSFTSSGIVYMFGDQNSYSVYTADGNCYTTGLGSGTSFTQCTKVDGVIKSCNNNSIFLANNKIYLTKYLVLYAAGIKNASYSTQVSPTECVVDGDVDFIDCFGSESCVYGLTSNGEIYAGGSNRYGNLMQGNTDTILKMVKLPLPSPVAIPSSNGGSSSGNGTSSGDVDVNFTQKDTLELTIQDSEVNFGDSHSVAQESTLVTASVKSSLPYSVTIKSNGNFVEQNVKDAHEISINNLSYKVDGNSAYNKFEKPNTDYVIASGQPNTVAEPNKTRDHKFQLKLDSLIGEKKGSYKATLQITAVQD